MSQKRKLKISIGICFALILSLVLPIFATYENALAETKQEVSSEKVEIEKAEKLKSAGEMFEGLGVSSCDYLYNLDGSADYIGMEFAKGGYAIFASETQEMMEYSASGGLPYMQTAGEKYYAGPANYLQREGGYFVNAVSGEKLSITEYEAAEISRQTRETLKIGEKQVTTEDKLSVEDVVQNILSDKNMPVENLNSAPAIDRDNLEKASQDYGTFISNYRYFIMQPTFGINPSDTCGPVAAQLLLSYNNYFNDRRIIPDRYLNGYDDATNTVKEPQKNPNYCTDPTLMDENTTGTRSEDDGENSFYHKMVTKIMSIFEGSLTVQVKMGIENYLKEYISTNEFSMSYLDLLTLKAVASKRITNEIYEQRPLIIGMSSKLGGANHFVVGYGYQDYTYSDGRGTYFGYVVHFGWKREGAYLTWVNSSWCDGYISLKMNHTHTYQDTYCYDMDHTAAKEAKCITCKYRTDELINFGNFSCFAERVIELPHNKSAYKDYNVTCSFTGNMLVQTFGAGANIEIYNNNRLITWNLNSGYGENGFVNFSFAQGQTYTVRVKLNDANGKYKVKTCFTPSDAEDKYNSYDGIWHKSGGTLSYTWTSKPYTTKVMCYTPTVSGNYLFAGGENDGTYVAIVDPESTEPSWANNDYDEYDSACYIIVPLIAGRKYFVVCCAEYLPSREHEITLNIIKWS